MRLVSASYTTLMAQTVSSEKIQPVNWRSIMTNIIKLTGLLSTLVTGIISMQIVIAEPVREEVQLVPMNGIELEGTSTFLLRHNGNTSAQTEGWATFCNGEKPNNYHCENKFFSYGCSEECKCCYYEEKLVKEQDVDDFANIQK